MSLISKIQALITAANTKTGETDATLTDAVQSLVDGYGGGITPSGSVTLTEENTYDVTDKAQAIVDFSSTRADLAEAVTAKGVDTLPTASFDTIATNIGLIEGGGGIEGVFQITTTEDLTNSAEIHAFIVANHPVGWRWINTVPLSITNGNNHFMCAATFDNESGTNNGMYTRRNSGGYTTISYTDAQTTATFVLPAGTTLLMTRGI